MISLRVRICKDHIPKLNRNKTGTDYAVISWECDLNVLSHFEAHLSFCFIVLCFDFETGFHYVQTRLASSSWTPASAYKDLDYRNMLPYSNSLSDLIPAELPTYVQTWNKLLILKKIIWHNVSYITSLTKYWE
jgi:hypothetical protein